MQSSRGQVEGNDSWISACQHTDVTHLRCKAIHVAETRVTTAVRTVMSYRVIFETFTAACSIILVLWCVMSSGERFLSFWRKHDVVIVKGMSLKNFFLDDKPKKVKDVQTIGTTCPATQCLVPEDRILIVIVLAFQILPETYQHLLWVRAADYLHVLLVPVHGDPDVLQVDHLRPKYWWWVGHWHCMHMEGTVTESLYCAGDKVLCVQVAAQSKAHIMMVILSSHINTAVLIWPHPLCRILLRY